MDTEMPGTPKGSSVQWGPIVGLVGAVAALGVIGYAVARGRSVPEPEPVVTVAPEPAPVYVDIRSLAAAPPKPEVQAEPTTQPADEVPGDVAKGTGVIAVKKAGKATIAKVAAKADKPLDPNYLRSAPTPRQSSGPRIYGESLAGSGGSGGRESGATIRESTYGIRNAVGGIR